jgi:hypothetical protein
MVKPRPKGAADQRGVHESDGGGKSWRRVARLVGNSEAIASGHLDGKATFRRCVLNQRPHQLSLIHVARGPLVPGAIRAGAGGN